MLLTHVISIEPNPLAGPFVFRVGTFGPFGGRVTSATIVGAGSLEILEEQA